MANEKKRWSKEIEAHGIPITIFEKANSAKLYYNVTRDGERVRGSLKTPDRKLAQDRAKAIAKSLVAAEVNGYDLRSLTLGQLFGKFFEKKAPTYTARWRKGAETRRTLFEAAWGVGKGVEDIGQSDVDHFTHLRRTGKIASETSKVTKVRDGTIEADLRWLSTVFRWARGYKVNGRPLVPSNPLDDLVRPREKNPRRPVASHDRYVKTMEKADDVDADGRLRCMLALARYTGRRENAICQLRADDVLWDQKAVDVVIAGLGLNEGDAKFYPEGGDLVEGRGGQNGGPLDLPLKWGSQGGARALHGTKPSHRGCARLPFPDRPGRTDQEGHRRHLAEEGGEARGPTSARGWSVPSVPKVVRHRAEGPAHSRRGRGWGLVIG